MWPNTPNYWDFGLCPSSGITRNTMFRELDLVPSSVIEVYSSWQTEQKRCLQPLIWGRKQIRFAIPRFYNTRLDEVQKPRNTKRILVYKNTHDIS
jgi:hypothetical protein